MTFIKKISVVFLSLIMMLGSGVILANGHGTVVLKTSSDNTYSIVGDGWGIAIDGLDNHTKYHATLTKNSPITIPIIGDENRKDPQGTLVITDTKDPSKTTTVYLVFDTQGTEFEFNSTAKGNIGVTPTVHTFSGKGGGVDLTIQ